MDKNLSDNQLISFLDHNYQEELMSQKAKESTFALKLNIGLDLYNRIFFSATLQKGKSDDIWK
jgi:hypothetical protein